MKPIFVIASLLSLAYSVILNAAHPRVESVNAILAPLIDAHSPGLALLVRQDGRTVFERGYGIRKLGSDLRIDARTNFRLASFTKQFTAMAIMLLVRDRKLSYKTRLTDVFPEFGAYGRQITIQHLLTHTSGLPDYESLMEKVKGGTWSPSQQIKDNEVFRLLVHEPHGKFTPGTSWDYSNSGYVLLGLIVAKISGEEYGDFLNARIFKPLQMSQTLVYRKGINNVQNRAYGHEKTEQGFIVSDQSSTSATLGDGGVYSNLIDLAKWDRALQDYVLLSPREMAIALAPVRLSDRSSPKWPTGPDGENLNPGQPVSYGFGWFLDDYKHHNRMWHSGSTRGFQTIIDRFPNERLSIVILSNRTDLNATQLALRVADLYLE